MLYIEERPQNSAAVLITLFSMLVLFQIAFACLFASINGSGPVPIDVLISRKSVEQFDENLQKGGNTWNKTAMPSSTYFPIVSPLQVDQEGVTSITDAPAYRPTLSQQAGTDEFMMYLVSEKK